MTTFQIIIRKFGVYFAKPVWSFIRNCVFWLFRLNKIKWAREDMKSFRELAIVNLMRKFCWKTDTVGDWTCWPITLIYSEMWGDCDDAAALAKWWFKEHGVEAEILNLYSAKEGHAICVTKDRTKMVTNERVVELNPATWEADVMSYFGGKYEVMF